MKYFVISDIHGYYDAMIESLQKAGYDQNDANHHLLVLGDMFDRGKHSDLVLEYLYPLHQSGKATLLLGNHDGFLQDFLAEGYGRAAFNILYNGFGETLRALSGIVPDIDDFDEIRSRILTRYPFLPEWLDGLPLYLELGDYVFVHGGIDGGTLDWKQMSSKHDLVWNREYRLPPIPGKTVVAGHVRVPTIRKQTDDYHLLFLHNPEYFDILYMEGKILIDRFVEVSNELNVLVLEIET